MFVAAEPAAGCQTRAKTLGVDRRQWQRAIGGAGQQVASSRAASRRTMCRTRVAVGTSDKKNGTRKKRRKKSERKRTPVVKHDENRHRVEALTEATKAR